MRNNGSNLPPPGIERVELKVTLPASKVERGLTEFGLERKPDPPSKVERRDIWFCERPDLRPKVPQLALLARGIILRVRRDQDRSGGSTLKLRGPEGCVDPDLWGDQIGDDEDAKIEGDWMADRHLVAASLDNDLKAGRIDEVLTAGRPYPVERLLSPAQEELAKRLLLGLDGLELLGPVDAYKWEQDVDGLERELAFELWEVGDLRFLELSTRAERRPGAVQARLHEIVGDLQGDEPQETKTRTVLEYLAKAAAGRG
jgi:hypothetical protein